MPDPNIATLRDRIKLALLREAYHRNLLTETELSQLIQRQQARLLIQETPV